MQVKQVYNDVINKANKKNTKLYQNGLWEALSGIRSQLTRTTDEDHALPTYKKL